MLHLALLPFKQRVMHDLGDRPGSPPPGSLAGEALPWINFCGGGERLPEISRQQADERNTHRFKIYDSMGREINTNKIQV